MSDNGTTHIDTRGMVSIHNALRRALSDAPAQLAAVPEGPKQAQQFLDYLDEVLWLAGAHHDTEEELLSPVLKKRAPEQKSAWSLIAAQHQAVTSCLETVGEAAERLATTGSADAKRALTNACHALYETLDQHFSVEEQRLLPAAAQVMTPAEWGRMSVAMLAHYAGTRPWLPFGLVHEAMPPDLQQQLLAQVPAPVSDMWKARGADAYANEMAAIRGTNRSGRPNATEEVPLPPNPQ
jgi:hemerythrin-like domain-containing protein